MTKVSVTGLKKDLRAVIEELHNMELLDIENYSGDLDTGSPFEEGEELSELLVDLRSLLSKLPEIEESRSVSFEIDEAQEKIDELNSEVNDIEDEIAEIQSELSELKDNRNFFRRVSDIDLDCEDLKGTRELDCFVGKIEEEEFKEEAPGNRYEIFTGERAKVIYYPSENEEYEEAIRVSKKKQFNVPEVEMEGDLGSICDSFEASVEQLEQKKEGKRERLKEISGNWLSGLEEMEGFLTEKVEKTEAPIRFAITESAFVGQGWLPSKKYGIIEERMAEVTDGRVHVQREEGENPPVKHENSKPVQPFEDLTDLVSVPKYNEIDPSFMIMLTFPLFFGFMIGDAGYGLTSLAVFYGGMKMFPKAADIFKSLMYASVATIIFGLAFGDAFGYMIFGSHSQLTALTGIHLFEQIPVLFHRAEHLGQVFNIAALIGVFHVNMGYLLGFYNEHVNHGFTAAFLEKGSWIMLEIGALLWYFVGMTAGLPVVVISIALLYMGEGIEGLVEIPSLLSNILSYLRLFGVAVAAVSLAAIVNGIADPLFRSGSMIGIAAGVAVLIFGHTFNTFIKIMEGFLQGIRLHYVELFGRFYEGGGRKYVPFGAK